MSAINPITEEIIFNVMSRKSALVVQSRRNINKTRMTCAIRIEEKRIVNNKKWGFYAMEL